MAKRVLDIMFKSAAKADQFAKAILSVAGTDRLLWGRDWPFADCEATVGYSDTIKNFHYVVPDADIRPEIDQTGLKFYFG